MANRSDDVLYDCMVIGGGPAGLASALQMARFNRKVVLLDSGMGRSTYHQTNHNYIGFPGGLKARDLRDLGRKQVRELPVACVDEAVTEMTSGDGEFSATIESGRTFAARTVIFATGVRDHFDFFPDWEQYVGRSLFWCIVCDGYSTRGKRIVLVGNDIEAAVTALQFLQFTPHVTLLTNSKRAAFPPRTVAALDRGRVSLVVDEIETVHGNDGIIAHVDLASGGRLEVDFLFHIQGCTPNAELAQALGVSLNSDGFIVTDKEQRTNVPGVFAAGDVTRDLAHQVATAVHEGITAATTANYGLYLPEQQHEYHEQEETRRAAS